MNSLPNEILGKIAECVYYETSEECLGFKSDILNLRLTCKKLAALGTRYAFRTLTLKHQVQSYRKINAFSRSDLGNKLQHLIYNFEEKPDPNTTDATRELVEWSRLEEYGLDVASLTSIFCRLKSLEKVSVVQTDMPLRCSPRASSNFFTALCTSSTRLSSLDLQSCVYLGPGSHVFDGYKDIFHQLRSLSLPLRDYGGHEIDYELFLTLAQSISLEELNFWSPCRHSTFPMDLYMDIDVPHLRAISLKKLDFRTPAELTELFIRHSPSLEKVELCDLELVRGTWENFFLEIRGALCLKSCNLDGDFVENGMTVFETITHKAVEDFVKGLTDENPFIVLQANVSNSQETEFVEVNCATQ